MTLQSVTGKGDAIGGDLVARLSTGGVAEHSWATNGSRCVVLSQYQKSRCSNRRSGHAKCSTVALAVRGAEAEAAAAASETAAMFALMKACRGAYTMFVVSFVVYKSFHLGSRFKSKSLIHWSPATSSDNADLAHALPGQRR